ncbi:MAG: hypothetical protein LAQ69_50565 [Acidobacteriia bacterium]|nr:hypothetical protein [Terriglobia bacterium]
MLPRFATLKLDPALAAEMARRGLVPKFVYEKAFAGFLAGSGLDFLKQDIKRLAANTKGKDVSMSQFMSQVAADFAKTVSTQAWNMLIKAAIASS